MATTNTQVVRALFLVLLVSTEAAAAKPHRHRHRRPCLQHVFYFHDILYDGHNYNNATAALVGSPQWGNKTILVSPIPFGDVVVFDDPITLKNNLRSPAVGRAQGMYFYDQRSSFGAWLACSFVFNSTEHVGTLNFVGSDLVMNKTRDISVIGGTGDFFMARGVATLSTDTIEGAYFRLRIDVKLYECW